MRDVLLLLMVASLAEAYIRAPRGAAGRTPPEMWMSTPELIEYAGFRAESHMVRTEDGYLLTLHRILPPSQSSRRYDDNHFDSHHNLSSSTQQQQQQYRLHLTPVLLLHCLATSSELWTQRQDRHNLAFLLARNGFDVWLINFRGSIYSRRHVWLSSKSPKFWDFSWHENGVLDLPAAMDRVLAETGSASLLLAGVSLGASAQLVLLSERPEYAAKVRASLLLSPAIYFEHPTSAMGFMSDTFPKAMPTLKSAFSRHVSNNVFLPYGVPMYTFCYAPSAEAGRPPRQVCKGLYGLICGNHDNRIMQVFVAHYPSGGSIRQFMHYVQSVYGDGKFRKYDFGRAKNFRLYGTAKPPEYDLSKIAAPVYMYAGLDDKIANITDAETLSKHVPNVKRFHRFPDFHHLDFVLGTSGISEVNRIIVEDMKEYI